MPCQRVAGPGFLAAAAKVEVGLDMDSRRQSPAANALLPTAFELSLAPWPRMNGAESPIEITFYRYGGMSLAARVLHDRAIPTPERVVSTMRTGVARLSPGRRPDR